MVRFNAVDPGTASGKVKELFGAVQKKLGLVPNMTRMMAHSPAVLEGYLGLSGALGDGLLDAKLREQLALAIAQDNRCAYCLSAHSAIGKMVGLTTEQIEQSRAGSGGPDAHATAGLLFARRVLETRGHIHDSDLHAVKSAGFSDGEVAEIVAHVALNVFTNYFNSVTQVVIDFPKVSVHASA